LAWVEKKRNTAIRFQFMIGLQISEHNVPDTMLTLRKPRSSGRPGATQAVSPVPQGADAASGSSAERCLRLLAQLAAANRALTLAELSQALHLPKATAHRLCAQLQASAYLARDVDEKRFVIGPALRRLALDTLNHGSVRGLRHELLASRWPRSARPAAHHAGRRQRATSTGSKQRAWRLSMDVGSHVLRTAPAAMFWPTCRRRTAAAAGPAAAAETDAPPRSATKTCAPNAHILHSAATHWTNYRRPGGAGDLVRDDSGRVRRTRGTRTFGTCRSSRPCSACRRRRLAHGAAAVGSMMVCRRHADATQRTSA
jgi:hypothetical protein